ncbi:flagellar assembly protein A [Accumulibacter sp.]|uniref:flagellar assembly protein A n=1 Tax=Accumulibacter sp. TaxID=2053492 RepID=UPI002CC231DA|nr:flagellar assembly protein A [Accumulibacter sp.]HRF06403.1 FapA family protein [Accumulibacter sp.]
MTLPEEPKSAIGNLADLEDGQIALSRYIVKRADGLYVTLSRLDSPADFFDFVNRTIALGLYFRALDYAQFQSLLYDEPASRDPAAPDEVFLALDIASFRPQRQSLYKELRIQRGEAVYLFEPIYLDPESDQEAAEDGASGGPQRLLAGEPLETRAWLDVDEFIASAWSKGVCFGIDVAAVREGILLDKPERRVVARSRPFVPGKNAEIAEQAPGLHRNNAPRRLLGDRVDLRQFETRYPQVAAGLRLVKKTPRTPGIDGRDVTGEPLPAPLPKDFDLARMAGAGTVLSREEDGEFLLAAVCGFLTIDTRSQQFSVTDKIVSHEGVSARTTGDLMLTGEEYEQHGEIQEKRVVTCRSITAFGDVFGKIVSTGGAVRLKQNLVGGSASNDDGDIVVEGVASGATLIAPHGCVTLKRADNCTIIARQVVIERATLCDIVADALSLELAEACAAAARNTQVRIARMRKEIGNVFLVLLPDTSNEEAQIAALREKRAALDKDIAAHRATLDGLREDQDVTNYLRLASKLRRGEASLSSEQEAGWRRLSALVAPALKTLSLLSAAVNERVAESTAMGLEIDEALAAAEQGCGELACTVERVEGETRISALQLTLADTPLNALPRKELKLRLRATDAATKKLFSGSSGHFSWAYQSPQAPL